VVSTAATVGALRNLLGNLPSYLATQITCTWPPCFRRAAREFERRVLKPVSFSVSMFALTAARTMAGLSATLIVLTASFTSIAASADSDYKKVRKIGADLKALAEDGNANSCRPWPSRQICRNINSAARVREMKSRDEILSC
jgi:hypothetical protein